MKPLQQDDIQDLLNDKTKRKFWFIHLPTKSLVRAINRSKARKLFKSIANLDSDVMDVRQANAKETMNVRN
jgi:hypothetical protein